MNMKQTVLVVMGQDKDKKPRAATFTAEEAEAAAKAANLMGLKIAGAESPEALALVKTLPAGRVYATGKGLLPLVKTETFEKLSKAVTFIEHKPNAEPPKPAPKPTDGRKKRPRGGVATGGPAVASRTLGMLGTILQRAVRDGALSQNPVRGIKRPKDQEAKPAFSFEKVKALGRALRNDAEENAITETKERKTGREAIRSLLLTGFRRMESLTLKWELIDADAHCVRFEDTKSGKQMRAIGRSALDHFGDTARATNLMSHFHEPRETFLGVSRDEPQGKGVGRIQSAQLARAIRRSKRTRKANL